jgi:type II secretory pathway pseudopilin PulG
MAKPSHVDDRGETLVEILVALVVMSITVSALVLGLAATVRMSDVHRKQATAGADVRAFAEAVENSVAASPTGYLACAGPTAYQTLYTVPDPTHYEATMIGIAYWNGTAFVGVCPVAGDLGVQRVSLQVRSKDNRATEKLDVIIRNPCRTAADFTKVPTCV